jgi:apolipoprotein N-acyltransferase
MEIKRSIDDALISRREVAMKTNLNRYRLAGVFGGLLLGVGQFLGYLCVFQLIALMPLMVFAVRDKRPRWAALAGLYMGITYTIPQMICLRMPVSVTVILLVWMTILLIGLCVAIAYFLPNHPILGPLTIGSVWYILDWVNYTVVPVWGMAQSFARSWTAYPFAIQFISITSISGMLFFVATLQGITAHCIHQKKFLLRPVLTALVIVCFVAVLNSIIWRQESTGSLKVAAAGWEFDDRSSEIDPHKPEGFEKLFAGPAREAAAQGARIFTTGELGFYLAKHEWAEWMNRFSTVAKDNNLWLVVGYFNIDIDENRLFFMSPEGQIVQQYTKTHLTPFEPGHKGNGDLKTIKVDGMTIGAMICQDDNFSRRTRHYGNLKADIVLCPTADWWTIKNAHLQAVRARAIECNYGIVRGAANGISVAISARGEVLSQSDHYKSGPGYVIEDVPVNKNRTFFSRFGYWPSFALAVICFGMSILHRRKEKRRSLA